MRARAPPLLPFSIKTEISGIMMGKLPLLRSPLGISLLESLTAESAVRITGRVADNPVVSLGGLEIIPGHVEITSRAETPLPIDENTGLDQRLDWRYLDLRDRKSTRLNSSHDQISYA